MLLASRLAAVAVDQRRAAVPGVGVRNLVVVVPGIGGSVLRPPEGIVAGWAGTLGSAARTLIRPGRLDLGEFPSLEPTGLIKGVTVVRGVSVLPGYARLVGRLETMSGNRSEVLRPGVPVGAADILLFPYDFRLGVAAAAERLARALHPELERSGASGDGVQRRVVVVAHS